MKGSETLAMNSVRSIALSTAFATAFVCVGTDVKANEITRFIKGTALCVVNSPHTQHLGIIPTVRVYNQGIDLAGEAFNPTENLPAPLFLSNFEPRIKIKAFGDNYDAHNSALVGDLRIPATGQGLAKDMGSLGANPLSALPVQKITQIEVKIYSASKDANSPENYMTSLKSKGAKYTFTLPAVQVENIQIDLQNYSFGAIPLPGLSERPLRPINFHFTLTINADLPPRPSTLMPAARVLAVPHLSLGGGVPCINRIPELDISPMGSPVTPPARLGSSPAPAHGSSHMPLSSDAIDIVPPGGAGSSGHKRRGSTPERNEEIARMLSPLKKSSDNTAGPHLSVQPASAQKKILHFYKVRSKL